MKNFLLFASMNEESEEFSLRYSQYCYLLLLLVHSFLIINHLKD